MSRLWAYLTQPEDAPQTQTCRIKRWAHDNAFTLCWISVMNVVGWFITIVTCH
jgi:hypothetical protein